MIWKEQDHPRDDDGKFTFKNGGINTSNEALADVLYKNSKLKKEKDWLKQKQKNKLLDILKDKATPADILYADSEKLKIKINEIKTKGKLTGGASEVKLNFEKPLQGKIRSEFGLRKAPIAGASTNHSGIDIAVPIGTPVKTIADGKVIVSSSNVKGYGTAVYIDHGIINGKHIVSEYGHLNSRNVKVGDVVKKGQIVARSGNTGHSTGPHLHITVRENNKAVNPRHYINFD